MGSTLWCSVRTSLEAVLGDVEQETEARLRGASCRPGAGGSDADRERFEMEKLAFQELFAEACAEECLQ